jgi:hypothetical protein
MTRTIAIAAAGAAAILAAAPALAHHSGAMFDRSQTKQLIGTVRDFQWTNPHCYIQLLVRSDKGQDQEWSLEMGAPMHLYANGWRPTTVRPGDKISVTIFPLRDGRSGGELQAATAIDGKPLGESK